MSGIAEECFYLHLKDAHSIRHILTEGIDLEALPTEDLHPVWDFAKSYFLNSNLTVAPTAEVFEDEMGDRLKDMGLDIHQDPEETIEWAIVRLKSQAVYSDFSGFIKELATDAAGANDSDHRLEILHAGSTELQRLVTSASSQSSRIDARDATSIALSDYERRVQEGSSQRGMTVGLDQLDNHMLGIHPGELAVIAAGPKRGKAQEESEPVLTPSGFVKISDIQVGDFVIGSSGIPIKVLAKTEWSNRPLLRVSTDDGGSIVVDENHDWTLNPHSHGRNVQTRSTSALRETIKTNRRFAYLPIVDPVEYDQSGPLPLDPYLLGAMIGDGGLTGNSPTFCKPEEWMHEELSSMLPDSDIWVRRESPSNTGRGIAGIRGMGLRNILDDLGLWGKRSHERFVPREFMTASVADRRSILSGLLDTDGGVESGGISFCSTSETLARQVVDLVLSLGGTARVRVKRSPKFQNGGVGRDAWIVKLRMHEIPFRLPRKIDDYESGGVINPRPPTRRIVSIDDAGTGNTVCIQVDAEDGLYVAKDFLVTHNSFLLAHSALANWRAGRATCLFTLENSADMTLARMACMASGVDARDWQRGTMNPHQIARMQDWIAELEESDVPLWIIQPDIGQRSFESMVSEARIRGAEALLIDQLTFVEYGGSARQAKHERIGNALHALKGMISTGRSPIPCFLAHQINREGVKASEKSGRLEMYHLAEASEVERTVDWALGLYASRDDVLVGQTRIQMLAARREENRHWQLNWGVADGNINVIREIQLEDS